MAEFTPQEQLMLELVNRARLDPAVEAARLGIDLNQGLGKGTLNAAAKQPLAPDELLQDAAFDHSQWMLDTDTFSHSGAGGSSPGDRMAAAGYSFTGSWTWGENIAWSGTTGTPNLNAYTAQLHDNLFRSPGHRTNILENDFREIGVGIAEGVFRSGSTNYNAVMATQNFAKSGSSVFITGIVIDDADNDLFYDIGEGRAGVNISVTSGGGAAGSDATGAGGGYAVAVAGGSYDVTFSGGGLPSNVTVNVATGNINAKIDLVDQDTILASADAILGAGALDLVLLGVAAIDGTGNAGNNALTGNRGMNVLSGEAGDDTLSGGQGRDVVTGGDGFDVFNYDARSDTGRTAASRDRITDFTKGEDLIDVTDIDARNKPAGDQDFVWRGTKAFTGKPGQLRYVKYNKPGTANDKTVVMGDINGDKKPDFHIELSGLHNLTADDFIL